MSTITDKKITDGQRDAVWVQHQQDRLTGTPQQNKAVFDEYSELIREHFNEAMDAIDERVAANDSDIEQLKETDAGEAATSARESAASASESAQATQDMLGRVISISNKIYTKSWDVEQEQDEFVFTAEGYTYNESDTYEVFVNGLKLSESEYTRNEDSVVLGSSISAGNTVEIIVTTNLKGKGIVDTQLNDDYTLTINYDDGTSTTTESIRGEKGEKGDKGDGIYDDTEVKTDIAVLESRVDSFTHLTEGSTTGDAELIDARIGADGTTYANAGDAVRGQVSDLKSDLDDFTEVSFGINLFDGDFDESGYIDASGQDASSANFKRTSKYYPIIGESNGYLYAYLSATVDTFNVYFYGADESYLGVKTFNNMTTGYVAIPTGATQFRVFTRVAFSGNVTLALSSVSSYIAYVSPTTILKSDVVDTDNIKDAAVTYGKLETSLKNVLQIWVGENLFDGNFDESGYIDSSGDQASANFKRTSKYYPITGDNLGYLYGYLSETVDTFNIDLYDSDKNYIDVVTINNATTKTMTLPSTAKYFRVFTRVAFSGNATIALSSVSSYIPYEEHYGIKEKGIIYDMLSDDVKERIGSWLYGKNIVFMGDSLVGNFYDSTGICAKVADATGANVINCAFGGTQMALRNTDNANLVYWNKFSGCSLVDAIASNDFSEQDTALANMTGKLSYFGDRLETLKGINWNEVDIVMWEWGVNDFQNGLVVIKDENDPTSLVSYYGAYCHTIETLLTAYPHLRIIPITPMWRCWIDADNDDAYLYGSDEHEIANQLLPDFAKCAIEVANKYHLPIINNYYELDANRWTYTQYFSGHDGVHPNENGRVRIANRVSHKLITLI